MGQGKSASERIVERLRYCLNKAPATARLHALLQRSTTDRAEALRYVIVVDQPDEPLRRVLRTLGLGVDERGNGEWVMMGPDLDFPDAVRLAVFQDTVRLLNETLGRRGKFSIARMTAADGNRLRVVRCPDLQPVRELAGIGL